MLYSVGFFGPIIKYILNSFIFNSPPPPFLPSGASSRSYLSFSFFSLFSSYCTTPQPEFILLLFTSPTSLYQPNTFNLITASILNPSIFDSTAVLSPSALRGLFHLISFLRLYLTIIQFLNSFKANYSRSPRPLPSLHRSFFLPSLPPLSTPLFIFTTLLTYHLPFQATPSRS